MHKPSAKYRPGIVTASKLILQISVVVLGSQLSLTQIVKVGFTSLPVMLGSLTVCLLGAYWIGRWLGIVEDLRTLIGVGTGICGASAIAAVAPIIGAASVDVAYAISTIFLFNMTAVLTFPFLGHLLGLSQHSFGLFAGTAINDMSAGGEIRADAPSTKSSVRIGRLVLWYLIGFVVVATANSVGIIPQSAHHNLVQVSIFLIAVAFSGFLFL